MHIEPGIVDGTKIVLSYATATAACGYAAKLAAQTVREQGSASFALRASATTALVFAFFEMLPHFSVGVSEVHFIFGSTLFLIFGAAPAAFGLALGLLLQGLFFVPSDLPQYGMNVTTLLVPLFAIGALADRIVARDTAYVDLFYRQA
ncbi:MAG TPA: energy-coupling factor ABC transporter permease, partial [Bradyrhizobium sp.]|nr:energy-coupling factor ABC transporter permease [Bradyrhizobium sp.]